MPRCGWAFHQVRMMGGSGDKASSDNWPGHDDSSSFGANDSNTLRKVDPGNSMYSFAHPPPCLRLKQRQMIQILQQRAELCRREHLAKKQANKRAIAEV